MTDLLSAPTSATTTDAAELDTDLVDSSARSKRDIGTRAALLVVLAAIGVWVAVAQPGVLASLAAVLIAPLVFLRYRKLKRQSIVLALTLGTVVASIDYLSWRLEVTNWVAWAIAIPLLVAEVFGILHAVGVMHTIWPRLPFAGRKTADTSQQPIFIMVPTANEGARIVEETVVAALEAKRVYLETFPHASVTIVICNDGLVANYSGWADVDALAERLDVTCVTRTEPGGAKAGNLEHARQLLGITGDAIMVIFDADQIATPEFLMKTVSVLDDSRVAWVQTGQYYSNMENAVSKWAEHQQAIFYSILLPGKSSLNSAFICGTNVVIRAAALDEIGGFPQDSVTEDFAASLELHKRWKSVFVEGRLAEGLGPMDLPAYLKQQDRWAVGTLGTLRTHFGTLVTPRRTGMTLQQRGQYLLAQTHYLSGLKDLIFVSAPILFLLTGIPAVVGVNMETLLIHFVPYFVLSQAAFWVAAAGRTSFRAVLIGFGSFPTLLLSLLTVLIGRKVAFKITSKQRKKRVGMAHLIPHWIGLAICFVAICWVVLSGEITPAEVVTLAWVTYSAFMFGGFITLGVIDWLGSLELKAKGARSGIRYGSLRRWVVAGSAIALVISAIGLVGYVTLAPTEVATSSTVGDTGE